MVQPAVRNSHRSKSGCTPGCKRCEERSGTQCAAPGRRPLEGCHGTFAAQLGRTPAWAHSRKPLLALGCKRCEAPQCKPPWPPASAHSRRLLAKRARTPPWGRSRTPPGAPASQCPGSSPPRFGAGLACTPLTQLDGPPACILPSRPAWGPASKPVAQPASAHPCTPPSPAAGGCSRTSRPPPA